ncbi:hypothetical protein AVEN_176266-1 [Araneus ventricosus]|uniref:Mos1 transposase HTH domain-containing protein n=1 Tax=Araneus ventricosus TaxID=182803 RepID=A0A4Y2LAA7_ARAVE|nr:hypothetical protein AVEN_176266-1 [Araneus ventricosus]
MSATTNLTSQCEKARHCEMEQRVNIKFCFKSGRTATETHEMLVKMYGVDAVSKIVFLSGLNALETERKMSKMSRVPVDHQQAQLQTTSNECDGCLRMIDGCLFE